MHLLWFVYYNSGKTALSVIPVARPQGFFAYAIKIIKKWQNNVLGGAIIYK